MIRKEEIHKIRQACPFVNEKGLIKFGYRMLHDMCVIWQSPPPTTIEAYGVLKGKLDIPQDWQSEPMHAQSFGVLLGRGQGYHTKVKDGKRPKFIPTPVELFPGRVVEYDKDIPWNFPEMVEDWEGNFHTLHMCPFVNIYGTYTDKV